LSVKKTFSKLALFKPF